MEFESIEIKWFYIDARLSSNDWPLLLQLKEQLINVASKFRRLSSTFDLFLLKSKH